MIRRLALGMLAAPFIIRPTLAQQMQQGGQGHQQPSAPYQGTSSPAAGSAEQARRMALSGMAFAHASAQLASTQSDSAAVKTFAELEASEQQAFIMARRLANLPQPEPTSMDAEKGRMIQQLQGVRGPEFDRLFIRGQIAGHQELLRVHQAISSTPENKEEAMLATVAVPAIRTHLAMLDSIQRTL
ncbi:MAG TPA: DUF4142 domain-containing protein [Acetobacteraceae bacterium]|nr:DUF4142 domain-containing protein [Acetobacteraceae bacterium]